MPELDLYGGQTTGSRIGKSMELGGGKENTDLVVGGESVVEMPRTRQDGSTREHES
jgi:hypothetical protein